MHSIEPLQPHHAVAYRSLMLQAYARHPAAFTSTVEEREALPLTWWQARLSASASAAEVVLGVTDREAILGVAGLTFNSRSKARHKVALFGMYVAADQQNKGLGRALLEAALGHARSRPGVQVVQLTVSENNQAALRLYEACGFQRFGLEPFAVATPDGFIAKVHMWRALTDAQ